MNGNETARLRAAIDSVEALHRPDEETGKCAECTYAKYSIASVSYPCPTVRAITNVLEGRAA